MNVSFLSVDRWNFSHWLLLSLLIHACVGLSAYGVCRERDLSANMLDKADKKLRIDLYGMVSDRQEQEKLKGENILPKPAPPKVVEKPPEPPKPKPKPKPKVAEKKPKAEKVAPQKVAETKPKPKPPVKSPVKVVQNTPKPKVAAPPPAPTPAQITKKIEIPVVNADAPKITSTGMQDDQNKRQSKLRDDKEGEIQVYLARLTRQVRENLVYPDAIRKKGVEGVVKIAFVVTQTGEIKAGTLMVERSSGFAALDKSALQSAAASAPFSPPKKEMRIAMNVAFTVDMAGTRKG